MKYTIEVKKLRRTIIEVDAVTKTEAMEKARKEAAFGSVLWSEPKLRTKLTRSKRAGIMR